MSAVLQQLQQLAAQQAAVAPDMNEAQKGGGGSKLLPVCYAMGRIVEYIDLGTQPQEFQGKAKEPADEFRIGVALWGEGITNEDGTPYVLRPYSIAVSRFEKSNTYKMFKALNYTGNPDIKHFAQFVGQAFLFKLEHHTNKAGKVSSIINWAGTLPPYDAISKAAYPVPEAPDDLYRLFLWDFPSIEAWNSLHIEGQNDDGKSKNFIQNSILGAINFEGSALHNLLVSGNVPYTIPAKAAPAAPAAPQAAIAAPVGVSTPVAAAPAVAAPVTPAPQQVAAPLEVQGAAPIAAPVGQESGTVTPPVVGSTVQSVPPVTISPSEPPALPAAVSLPVMPPAV